MDMFEAFVEIQRKEAEKILNSLHKEDFLPAAQIIWDAEKKGNRLHMFPIYPDRRTARIQIRNRTGLSITHIRRSSRSLRTSHISHIHRQPALLQLTAEDRNADRHKHRNDSCHN